MPLTRFSTSRNATDNTDHTDNTDTTDKQRVIHTNQVDGIQYGICEMSDLDEMVRLLAQVFTERDPPAVAMGLVPSEFDRLVRLFGPRSASDGLTVVARSVDTGEMVGALFTEDSAAPMPAGTEGLSPKFEPIFDILSELDAEYRHGRELHPGERLHLFLLGVAGSFGGRGIAQRLVKECLANAARHGYRMAVTEATNPISQHVFRKLGFVERVRRSYRDHRYNGQAVFASIADRGGPILMDNEIDHAPR
jgi:ribosomal protein S18 acetylase RimI-like enzyme